MFLTKRGKIAAYLKTASPSPFAELLAQWHTDQMRERLESLGSQSWNFTSTGYPTTSASTSRAAWTGCL